MTEKKTGTKKATTSKAGTSKAKAAAAAAAAEAEAASVTAAAEVVAAAPDEAPAAPMAPEAKVTIEASPPAQAAEAEAMVEAAEDVVDAIEAADLGPPPEGMFSLEQCVEFVLRAIVQNQEALTIVRKEEEDKVRISVAVAPEDLGKVIGKQGRTINALRTVVKTAAARTNTQVVVDLEGKAV